MQHFVFLEAFRGMLPPAFLRRFESQGGFRFPPNFTYGSTLKLHTGLEKFIGLFFPRKKGPQIATFLVHISGCYIPRLF